MNDNSAAAGIKGMGHDISGKAKEMAGNVVGNDDLSQEGRAEQDRARHEREAAEKRAKAEKAEAQAHIDEERQEAAAKER